MVNQFSDQNFFLKHVSHRYLTYQKQHVSLISSNLRCSSTSFPRLCPMCHQRLMHVLQRKGSLAQHIEEIQTEFSDIRLLKAFSMHVYLLNLQKLVTLLKFTRLHFFFFIKHCLWNTGLNYRETCKDFLNYSFSWCRGTHIHLSCLGILSCVYTVLPFPLEA